MNGYAARHRPEEYFGLPAYDDDSATPRYANPTPRYDDSPDGDALAFFSIATDDSGAAE